MWMSFDSVNSLFVRFVCRDVACRNLDPSKSRGAKGEISPFAQITNGRREGKRALSLSLSLPLSFSDARVVISKAQNVGGEKKE